MRTTSPPRSTSLAAPKSTSTSPAMTRSPRSSSAAPTWDPAPTMPPPIQRSSPEPVAATSWCHPQSAATPPGKPQTQPAFQTVDQDHDNDGVDNGVEYFLGGNTVTTGFTPLPGPVSGAVTWVKSSTYTGGPSTPASKCKAPPTSRTGSTLPRAEPRELRARFTSSPATTSPTRCPPARAKPSSACS